MLGYYCQPAATVVERVVERRVKVPVEKVVEREIPLPAPETWLYVRVPYQRGQDFLTSQREFNRHPEGYVPEFLKPDPRFVSNGFSANAFFLFRADYYNEHRL